MQPAKPLNHSDNEALTESTFHTRSNTPRFQSRGVGVPETKCEKLDDPLCASSWLRKKRKKTKWYDPHSLTGSPHSFFSPKRQSWTKSTIVSNKKEGSGISAFVVVVGLGYVLMTKKRVGFERRKRNGKTHSHHDHGTDLPLNMSEFQNDKVGDGRIDLETTAGDLHESHCYRHHHPHSNKQISAKKVGHCR